MTSEKTTVVAAGKRFWQWATNAVEAEINGKVGSTKQTTPVVRHWACDIIVRDVQHFQRFWRHSVQTPKLREAAVQSVALDLKGSQVRCIDEKLIRKRTCENIIGDVDVDHRVSNHCIRSTVNIPREVVFA